MTTSLDPIGPEPVAPARRPEPMSRAPFQDLDRLRNAYGMVGIISQRLSSGLLTFSIFREFERDGEIARTAFIPEDLAEVFLEFSGIVIARVREIRATKDLPYPLKAAT